MSILRIIQSSGLAICIIIVLVNIGIAIHRRQLDGLNMALIIAGLALGMLWSALLMTGRQP